MGSGERRVFRCVLLLLPLLGPSGALPDSWLPGDYTNTVADVLRFLSDYNGTAEEVLFKSVSARWNYNTNITSYNSELEVGQVPESRS